MCGILGFIGKSKVPETSKRLITSLFKITQSRGVDASGFYCSSDFNKKQVFFYKEPQPSTLFVENINYKKLWDNELNVGIFHCRAATQGVGIPAQNQNNHPFVSENRQRAIIHNGFINKIELKQIKSIFETNTDCDSEVVLRILEQQGSLENNICDFLSFAEKSAFSIAMVEVDESIRSLTLLRNAQRPMCIVDCRKNLGQMFFCSTPQIFFESLIDVPELEDMGYAIADLEKDTVFNIRYDIANNMSFFSYNIKYLSNNNKKNWNHSKIKAVKNMIFEAPIQFNNDLNVKEKLNLVEKLEEIILLYRGKQENNNFAKHNEEVSHHIKALQLLLQKEQL